MITVKFKDEEPKERQTTFVQFHAGTDLVDARVALVDLNATAPKDVFSDVNEAIGYVHKYRNIIYNHKEVAHALLRGDKFDTQDKWYGGQKP